MTLRQIVAGHGECHLPASLCRRVGSYTIAFATPTPIITDCSTLFKSGVGDCVCTCAVWDYHILRRFLFASMGKPNGGRETEYHPRGRTIETGKPYHKIEGGKQTMKKALACALSLALLLSLTACQKSAEQADNSQPDNSAATLTQADAPTPAADNTPAPEPPKAPAPEQLSATASAVPAESEDTQD